MLRYAMADAAPLPRIVLLFLGLSVNIDMPIIFSVIDIKVFDMITCDILDFVHILIYIIFHIFSTFT